MYYSSFIIFNNVILNKFYLINYLKSIVLIDKIHLLELPDDILLLIFDMGVLELMY